MIRNTFKGLAFYSKALSMLFKHNLWMYFLAPTIISIAMVFGVFKTRSRFVDPFREWIGHVYPEDWAFSETVNKVLSAIGGGLGELLAFTTA